MVNRALSSIRGTNCNEDIDTFLLNCTSPTQSLQVPLPEICQRLQVQGQVVNLVSQPKQRTLFNWKILLHTTGATCVRNLSPLSVSNVGVYCKRTEIEMHDTSLLSTPKHMTSAKTEDSRYPALRLSKHWDFSRMSSRQTHLDSSLREQNLRENFKIRLLNLPCFNTQQLILLSPSF